MDTEPVAIFATFHPAEGQEDAVRAILDDVIKGTRSEPGNETYDLYRSEGEDGARFHLFERYTDMAAVQAHRATDHYRKYRAAIIDLLRSPIDVNLLSDVDVR